MAATDTAPATTTFDPDEFMKSRGAATDFDPDEFMKQRQQAAAPTPTVVKAPEEKPGLLKRTWDVVAPALKASIFPAAGVSELAGKAADLAHQKAGEAEQSELANVAAGKPRPGYSAFTPAAGYDLLARGARAVSGATSPAAVATTAAGMVAPEVVAPALVGHGGIGTIEGLWDMNKYGASPETAERTLSSAAELAGGTALGAHRIASGPGPLAQTIADRNPVERGTQAYQKLIAPTSSKAIEQLDDTETIKRALPYLGEQERLSPVQAKQATGPQGGQRLGVMNYRQNALAAADRLWNEKITPVTAPYDNAPIDAGRVAAEIRNTIDPNGPPNEAKVKAVHDLADHYNQPTTVKEALKKVKALNGDRQVAAYENALPDQQAAMLNQDPAIEAKVKAVNILRDAVFDSIERHGSPAEANYVREARKDFGSLQQVAKNLAASQVPTPGSFTEKLINTAKAIVRPRTAPIETLFQDPNTLAAKSSRLFGAANEPTRPQPTPRAAPWAPPAPSPFIVPPGAPQAPPNAAGAVEGIGSVTGSSPGTRGTAGTRIAGLLPENIPRPSTTPPNAAGVVEGIGSVTGSSPGTRGTAGTRIAGLLPENIPRPSTTPPNAAGVVEGTGTVQNPQAVGARGIAGTRFGPKGLLPGPVWGEPVARVGNPPPVGFPARMGLWEGYPNPNAAGPSFEPLPTTPVTQAPGGQFRTGTAAPGPIKPLDLPSRRLDVPPQKPAKAGQAKLDLTGNVPRGNIAAQAAQPIKVSTDSMGIRWAESPNGVRVSVPKSVADADVEAYARPKLVEQEAEQRKLGKSIGTTPVKEAPKPKPAGPSLADRFNAPPEAELAAAEKFEGERQANKAARIKDIANIAEQAFNAPAAKAAMIEPAPVAKPPAEAVAPAPATTAEERRGTQRRQTEGVSPTGRERRTLMRGVTTAYDEPTPGEKLAESVRQQTGRRETDIVEGQALQSIMRNAEKYEQYRNADPKGRAKMLTDEKREMEEKPNKGILPGMEQHVAKQNEGAARVKGEDLTRQANTPKDINVAAGEMERKSPLFRGTEASPQRELLPPAERAASIEQPKQEVKAEQSQPVQKQFTPEEIEQAETMIRNELDAIAASDRPGRHFIENEPGEYNPQRIQSSERGVTSGGHWMGIKTSRNLYPFMKANETMSPSQLEKALRQKGDSPTYQRAIRSAVQLIRDEKLTPEQRQTKYEAERKNPERPADALDLIEGLKKFRKPTT